MEPKTELQRNAIIEARRKEFESNQRAMDIQWLNSRMEDCRMGRCLALIQREAEMEKDFQERTDHAAIVNARARKETLLGMEIAKVHQEEACNLLRRHYLRERDPSLRELSKKLQAGYVCRDLKQQILNNEYRRLQDKAEANHASGILLNALYNDKEVKEREEKETMERNMEYRKELQQQLADRHKVTQCQYEDSLVEKKMLEDISRTIADEDQRELERKREQTEKMRREMVTFVRARDALRAKQKEMAVNEEREIEEQRKAAADRSSAIKAAREENLRKKEELNAGIAAKILADKNQEASSLLVELVQHAIPEVTVGRRLVDAERQERENVIKLLQEQEYLEKNIQDEITAKEKLERVKIETRTALTEQMETRRRSARELLDWEAHFRQNIESKIAADEEKEREKQRMLKMKAQQYSDELRKQIEDNARRRKKDVELEERRAQNVWDTDRAWRAEVSQERKKIIEEHVPHLLGYLQAGVIKEEDLPAVREGCNKHEELAKLDVESMSISKRPTRFSKCNAQCRVLREY